MSFNNNKSTSRSNRGFTIVELLIVIVVIGILAAITIVAYNGVTARANTTSAAASAGSLLKKIEAYNAEVSAYPTVLSTTVLATANTNTSYFITGVTAVPAYTTKPANSSVLIYSACGTGSSPTAPATVAAITNPTGAQVGYWNYQTSAVVNVTTGTASGTVNGNTVACIVSS